MSAWLWLAVGASLVLSVAAVAWLAWLSPPAHWFDARSGEPRIAVPVDRLTPSAIPALRETVSLLEARIAELEDSTASIDVADEVTELDDRVAALETALEEATAEAEDTAQTLSDLCDGLLRSDNGALFDLYISAC